MKTLLLGATGFLGSYLASHLSVEPCPGRIAPRDLRRYDFVINCAGLPSVESCALCPERSFASNIRPVAEIVGDSTFRGRLIHFSSYYVYDGQGPQSEDDEPTRATVYARHKLVSEDLAVERGDVVFRLGKLFGHDGRAQSGKLEDLIRRGGDVVLDRVRFNPTSLEQVREAVRHWLREWPGGGIWNLACSGEATHAAFGELVASKAKTSARITEVDRIHRPEIPNYGRFEMFLGKIDGALRLRSWTDEVDRIFGKRRRRCLVS